MNRPARRGATVGGLLGLAVFAWVLFEGRVALARTRYTTNFFDLQTRAFLAGRLDIRPARALGIEAIMTGRRAYVYFGPVPSLIRLPILAVTHRFDGRLGQPSMLLAAIVLTVALARLAWVAHLTVGGAEPLPRQAWWTGSWVFLGLCGTVVIYLASLAIAYHEAILWGIALASVAYDAILRFMLAPSTRRAFLVGGTASLAFLTRASIGMGPVVAAGLLAAVALWRTWRYRERPTPDEIGRQWWRIGATTATGIGLYVAINLAKFRTVYQLPLDRQVYSRINESRKAAFAANGGSLFGLKFMPTAMLQYLRPDGLRLSHAFPYVDFGPRARVVGGVTFDTISRSASLTATSPVFVLCAVVGLVVLARRRGATLAVWILPIVGAVVGTVAALDIAFIAHRYLGDLLPVLLLPAAVGWAWLAAGIGQRPAPLHRTVRRVGLLLIIATGLWSTAANLGLATLQQRAYSARTPPDLAAFVSRQLDWPGTLSVTRSATLDGDGTTAPAGTLRIVGSCDALYRSDGEAWVLVEGGATRYRLTSGDVAATGGRPVIRRRGDRVMVSGDGFTSVVTVADRVAVVDVYEDPAADTVRVLIDNSAVLSLDGVRPPEPTSSDTGAVDPASPRPPVAGTALPTPTCDRLQRVGGASS